MLYPEDLWFLEKITDKKDSYLPSIICAKMAITRIHSKKFLPYGCVITALLRTKFPQLTSSSVLSENQIPIFKHTSLHKMGCVFNENHHKYTKVVHCHQRYNYEMDSNHEEEEEEEEEKEKEDKDDNALA